MKVLLVEDDAGRRAWFDEQLAGQTVTWTDDPDIAIALLEATPYDVLFLDHDLGREPRVGRDVAVWLAAHPAVLPSLWTIVHSMNSVSATKIVRELSSAGRRALWAPFDGDRRLLEALTQGLP